MKVSYTRDGHHFYLSTEPVDQANAVLRPSESSWDGQFSWRRRGIGRLYRADNVGNVPAEAIPPEDSILGPLLPALRVSSILGVAPALDRLDYKLVSAVPGEDSGNVIVLTFIEAKRGLNLVSTHDRRFGYFPTHYLLSNVSGHPIQELRKVRYVLAGPMKDSVFPVEVEVVNYGAGQDAITRTVVDEASLRVNYEVDPAIFQLKPYPGESIVQMGTGAIIQPPTDENWVAEGSVSPPWTATARRYDQLKRGAVPAAPVTESVWNRIFSGYTLLAFGCGGLVFLLLWKTFGVYQSRKVAE